MRNANLDKLSTEAVKSSKETLKKSKKLIEEAEQLLKDVKDKNAKAKKSSR